MSLRMPTWRNDQIQTKQKRKGAAHPSKQWATVSTHFLAMSTQPQMCPLGSLCREHCQGHLPGRLVRPPRILLLIRAAGRCPQSTKEQERRVTHPRPSQVPGSLRSQAGDRFPQANPVKWSSRPHRAPLTRSPRLAHRREILLPPWQDCLDLETWDGIISIYTFAVHFKHCQQDTGSTLTWPVLKAGRCQNHPGGGVYKGCVSSFLSSLTIIISPHLWEEKLLLAKFPISCWLMAPPKTWTQTMIFKVGRRKRRELGRYLSRIYGEGGGGPCQILMLMERHACPQNVEK